MVEKALEIYNATKAFSKNGNRSLVARVRGRSKSPKQAVVAVDNVSITVERGEIFGILGPNGSGKSTLVRLVSTLMIPDTGQIRVFGYEVQQEEGAVKRLINRVSVDAGHRPRLTGDLRPGSYASCDVKGRRLGRAAAVSGSADGHGPGHHTIGCVDLCPGRALRQANWQAEAHRLIGTEAST